MIDAVHHDGSALYLSDPEPDLGDTVEVRVRVPRTAGVTEVFARSTPDGEPHFTRGVRDGQDEHETWWRVPLPLHNPVAHYRFLLTGPNRYTWLNGAGVHHYDVPDSADFRLATFPPPPAWVRDAVFYQVFVDRFARGGGPPEWPPWSEPAAWDEPVRVGGARAMRQLYGGDLPGITAQLDHIASLGVNALYLTPFFPAESNHRYNASSFEHVDPLLGGEGALAELTRAAHARGMHVIGDLTLNHCGNTHPWFRTAQKDPDSVEAGFFTFRHHPNDYVAWFDVPTLPKFDHRSGEFRRRFYEGGTSVAAHWLRPPFDLDGWRVDVANMAGRHGEVDLNAAAAHAMRRTVRDVKPDTYLVAEHAHDATHTLLGDGWDGTMNYAGFTRQVWSWLRPAAGAGEPPLHEHTFLGVPARMPRLGGGAVMASMRLFAAGIPWRARIHNLNLLDSHDTSRFATVVASADAAAIGAGLLFTMPGVPMLFAGDEVGVPGSGLEGARQPMPWDEARWAHATLARYRALGSLRHESVALREGGFRWVHASDDALCYLREAPTERVLCLARRAPGAPLALPVELTSGRPEPLLDAPPVQHGVAGACLPGDGPGFSAWRLE